jgi:16S rRNA (guanine527-N7)-methyltransferase
MGILETLPEGALSKLREYVQLLDRWKNVTNLVSYGSVDQVWKRHIEDSLRLQRYCPSARVWLDVGSGAGFPGLVIGVILSGVEGAKVHCVESDGRKCAFLRTAVQHLQIPVKVHHTRIESFSPSLAGDVEVVTARAFSSLESILNLTQPFLDRGAVAALPRGKSARKEVEALDLSRYTVSVMSNPHHSDGVILHIQNRDREL